MGVKLDIRHGAPVKVRLDGEWFPGVVVENVMDNDRLIVVRTEARAHDGPFLEGHGVTVGHRSDDIHTRQHVLRDAFLGVATTLLIAAGTMAAIGRPDFVAPEHIYAWTAFVLFWAAMIGFGSGAFLSTVAYMREEEASNGA